MGQFKPMVKMETTEPTVELKLKKGGHVNFKKGGAAKAEAGHKKMHHMMDGGVMGALAGTPALVGRPALNAPVASPGRPSMAMRRKAMMAKMAPKTAMAPAMGAPMGAPPMKKGGKAEGKDMDMAQDKAMIKKAFKQHDMQEHKGGKGTSLKLKKGGKYAKGGSAGDEETYGNYDTTEVHEAKPDRVKGPSGSVKESNAGGYKRGGKIHKMATGGKMSDETTRGTYATTEVHEVGPQREHGPTGGVKEEQGGYKRGGSTKKYAGGGSVDWENRPANGTPPGVTNKTTGGVKEGNAGGFKKGGAAKKHFATGGSVNDTGHAVVMPQASKPASRPVSNDRQSGTFKRGGRV